MRDFERDWRASTVQVFEGSITVTSLHADFTPSAWGYFTPTIWDICTLIGSFGLFFTFFCLFVRFMPMVALAEIKTVLPQADPHFHPHGEEAHHA